MRNFLCEPVIPLRDDISVRANGKTVKLRRACEEVVSSEKHIKVACLQKVANNYTLTKAFSTVYCLL